MQSPYKVKDLIADLQVVDPEAVILTGYMEDWTILSRPKKPLVAYNQGLFPYSKGCSGEEIFQDEGLPLTHPYINLIG